LEPPGRGTCSLLWSGALGFAGGAVDYARWLSAREQTQNAIDAALLGAGRVLQTSGGDEAAALQVAQQYYDQLKSRAIARDTVSFAVVDGGRAVQATGTAFVATPIVTVLGIGELPVHARGKAVMAGAGGAGMITEVSVMLDVTGSMSGQKIADLKLAAKDLIDIVV
jgi:hypothetical protein